MQRTEPATLDLHGATWGPRADVYVMDATALRYEQYEICFAAKVRTRCCGAASKCSTSAASGVRGGSCEWLYWQSSCSAQSRLASV